MQSENAALEIFSVDKNIRACKYLKLSSPKTKVVCADIFHPPFKWNGFDIVHCSLFLHHFNKEQLKSILGFFKKTAKYGIIINDFRRNILAYWGIKILTIIFSKSEMIKNDAPISVARGFTKNEILEILNLSKFSEFEIKRKWSFRWLIILYL